MKPCNEVAGVELCEIETTELFEELETTVLDEMVEYGRAELVKELSTTELEEF